MHPFARANTTESHHERHAITYLALAKKSWLAPKQTLACGTYLDATIVILETLPLLPQLDITAVSSWERHLLLFLLSRSSIQRCELCERILATMALFLVGCRTTSSIVRTEPSLQFFQPRVLPLLPGC